LSNGRQHIDAKRWLGDSGFQIFTKRLYKPLQGFVGRHNFDGLVLMYYRMEL
jgi:hypothetical protein